MNNYNNSNNQGNQNYFGNDYFNQNNQQQINNPIPNNNGFVGSDNNVPNQWGGNQNQQPNQWNNQPTQNDWVNNQGQMGGSIPNQNNGGYNQYPNNGYNPYPNNGNGYYNPQQNYNPISNQGYGTPLQQSNKKVKKPKKQKKQKKRSGCLVSILKFFLILAIIIGIIVGAIAFIGHKNKQKEIEELESNLVIDTVSNELNKKIEELKSEDSDIAGMTKYDKIEKGLSPNDGADSDKDGLTDKEEIEIYHSDPLKASTSGDGIPDSYKVKNNLIVSEKYNIENVGYQGYNQYSNIEIKDRTSENAVVSITEIEGYKVQGLLADKVYAVINYDGELTFDFSDYITSSDYMIFKKNDSVVSEYEILKDKNGIVTVDTKGEDCVVGIVGVNVKLNSALDFNATTDSEVQIVKGNDSVIVMLPITALTGQMEIYVFEKSIFGSKGDRSAELTKTFSELAEIEEDDVFSINVTHQYVNPAEFGVISKVLGFIASGDFITQLVETDGVEVSEEDESTFQAIMNFFIMVFNVKSEEWSTFFTESENIEDNKTEENKYQKGEKRSTYVSGFDITKDALPFANLGTYISPGGNCAGFAMITSAIFNETGIASSGSLTDDGITYTYDIGGIKEFETFFDLGLSDYKNKDYWVSEYGNKMDSLPRSSFGEQDAKFLDFIGYKWAEGNQLDKRALAMGDEILWSEFEEVLSFFKNNNKILNVGMNSIESGHAINAYGLEQDSDNPNIWYILVYDNNFPNHKFGEYSVNNWIKVVKKNPLFGESYIEYEYYPLPEHLPNYRYTSKFTFSGDSFTNAAASLLNVHAFVIYDEFLHSYVGGELE